MKALLPDNEAETFTDVCQSDMPIAADEKDFDDFVSLAARLCDAPISLVTTVVANGQQRLTWQVGLTLPVVARNDVFSAHTILQLDLLIVRDALADNRFSTNPLVIVEPHVRFYAGAPLVAEDGRAFGTLAVMDRVPRALSHTRQECLRALARRAATHLQLQSRLDDMERVVAEHRRVEETLRESVTRFQELYDEAPFGYHELNAEGRITSVNRTELQMLGYTSEEMLGHYVWEFTADQKASRRAVAAKLAGSQPLRSFERNVQRKDGTVFPALIEDRLLRDGRGLTIGIRSTLQDISERRAAEKALRESEERHRTLIKSLPQRVFFKDCRSAFISVNDSFAGDLGMRPVDLIGKSDHDLFPKESADKYRADDLRVIETRRSEMLEEVNVVQGRERIVEVVKAPVIGDDGDVLGVLGLFTDITDRKQAEQKVREFTTRLEQSNRELQDFASVASHDLQEPLRKIQAFGDRLKTKCADGFSAEGRDYLERMQNAAKRMQTLINDLLMFSRVTTKAQPFVPTDLAEIAREVLSDLEVRVEETGGRVELNDLPTIDADALQMRQLLQNLIGNALKFRRPEASPVVKVRAEIFRPPAGDEVAESSPDEVCQITVEDNGIGFDEKYLDRIFIVFQRLHGRGEYEGTGVGLAVCRKIAERHGGRITAESTPGEGATFRITLPVKHSEGESA